MKNINYKKTLLCMKELFFNDKSAYKMAAMAILFQEGHPLEEKIEDEYVYALIERSLNHNRWVIDNRFTWHDITNALCYLRGNILLMS